ncbi:MAG TPA: TIGR00266 family protein [Oligoflexus sp.]|uniref:TIGR00266 family protein n=1 Tax=Oligoflexus sp. TaxID=1971216 RepID=UPI002D46B224|nr:TIGR00266 family protein [Oligoflexus sp.]HYX39591.1 TIGR00266 family protein [Oligoflexus sp.]
MARTSHEVDFEILGHSLQVVEIELDPGETVIAEAGAMNYMEDGIVFETRMGDGSEATGLLGKLFGAGKRLLTGESLFLTHFTNRGVGKKRVAFSSPFPGQIVPVDLGQSRRAILCQKDSFLAAAYGTKVSMAFNKRLGAGFFGGEGFIMQKMEGDGKVFIHAGGHVVHKQLNNEVIRIDTGCVVGFEEGIDFSIERAGNLRSMLFGGEGLFLATLRGTGSVWIQSLPLSRLADRIIASAPSAGGAAQGEGSILGGLGRILDGD